MQSNLTPLRVRRIGRIVPDIHYAAIEAETGLIAESVLVFAISGVTLLAVERLVGDQGCSTLSTESQMQQLSIS